jgi:hypothetical protein
VPVSASPLLVTPDVERLRTFYAGLLGAEVTDRFPDDGPVFALGLRDVLLPRVADLGGRVTGGPTDMPWGHRVAHVRDPDGNALNLNAPSPAADRLRKTALAVLPALLRPARPQEPEEHRRSRGTPAVSALSSRPAGRGPPGRPR